MLYGSLKQFALTHRKEPTIAEAILWDQLRSKKEGYKFRRQHIIGQFIADFVCLDKGFVIEIDGNYHQLPEMKISDTERTKQLNDLGFEVLRFTNDDVLYNAEETIKRIHSALNELPTKQFKEESNDLQNPSPTGGRWKGAVL